MGEGHGAVGGAGKPGILWVSHRGLREDGLVENTRRAFETAVACGFEALETDLRATADGEIVLCHDPDLARVGGPSHRIADLTREALAVVRLADGQALLTLREFLGAFPDRFWTFDVKPETGMAVLRALQGLVAADGALAPRLARQARFLFWRRDQQAEARRLFPAVPCLARESECRRAGLAVLARAPWAGGIRPGVTYSLPPRFRGIPLFHPAVAEAYRRRGARLLAFLPTTADEVAAAVAAGFDEILMDGPKPMMRPRA